MSHSALSPGQRHLDLANWTVARVRASCAIEGRKCRYDLDDPDLVVAMAEGFAKGENGRRECGAEAVEQALYRNLLVTGSEAEFDFLSEVLS